MPQSRMWSNRWYESVGCYACDYGSHLQLEIQFIKHFRFYVGVTIYELLEALMSILQRSHFGWFINFCHSSAIWALYPSQNREESIAWETLLCGVYWAMGNCQDSLGESSRDPIDTKLFAVMRQFLFNVRAFCLVVGALICLLLSLLLCVYRDNASASTTNMSEL